MVKKNLKNKNKKNSKTKKKNNKEKANDIVERRLKAFGYI